MIGKSLGHYAMIELLGQGGMGAVYRAQDQQLGREIALKVLPAQLAENDEFNQRFEREVKSLAALRHPNIVTIHSFEEADGFAFYTMELVKGKTLDALLPNKGLPLDEWFRIAVPVADAVSHAHAQGIVHRDLKPTNIMLDRDGTPKVLDFGLAKLSEAGPAPGAETVPLDDFQTGEGRILGTVAYMSPEQGEGKATDSRSDIFSLGIVLYEMATGQKPFTGDTPVSTLSSIIKDTPASITALNQRLPRHLWRIIKKCLEKDPGRRYQSVIDLRNDLEDLKSEIDSGELAAPLAAAPRGGGRARPWFWLALAVVLVAGGLLGYNLLKREGVRGDVQLVQLGGSVNLTRSGKVLAADLSPDGKLLVYTQREQNLSSLRVLQLSTSSDVEILSPAPDAIGSVQITPDGDLVYYLNTDRKVLYRIAILGGDPQRIFENVGEYALASDGRRLAIMRSVESRRELWLGDVVSGRQHKLEEVPVGFSNTLAWSQDGEGIDYNALQDFGMAETLMRFSLADSSSSRQSDTVWTYIDAMDRLRDGSGLIFSGPRKPGPLNIQEPSELWIVPATGDEPVRLTHDPFEYSSVGSDVQGNRLSALQQQYEHTVWVMASANAAQPRQVMYTSRAGKWWLPLVWTRDHTILYPALAGDEVHIWEVGSDGANRRRLTASGTFNLSSSISPDGRTLAYSSNRDGSLKIYLMDREGGVPRRLTTADEEEFFPDFSPDGQWVVYNVFTVKQSQLRRTSLSDGRSVDLLGSLAYMPHYSPDGLSIACLALDTLTYEYNMAIISADDGRLLRTLPGGECEYGRIRWTPAGDALVYGHRRDDADNLWLQPLDGGEPRQLTRFTSGSIAGFAISTDGDSLAVAMMEEVGDVVMFEDYRGQIARAMGQIQSGR